ncbi:uncharacterized protein LOC133904592 [Phragmites australis]|uniref:uncharacterized protein LOC133904592 n=1 Tax=Phragmites australis TaxID=29695 RepID=UPI002D767070|nr:uncharacterized protein LOC133904592 [Phragmites australis]
MAKRAELPEPTKGADVDVPRSYQSLEDVYINSHAVFMGYMWMAGRGLGFLVFVWITVVLLGGFVSMLAKKDFWCLTVISLLQTRALSTFADKKIGNITDPYIGLCRAAANAWKSAHGSSPKRRFVAVKVAVQVVASTVILIPLSTLHLSGPYICSLISLWRLIKRDYGKADGEAANLKMALVVLYSLVLLQGVVFTYSSISNSTGYELARMVAKKYGFRGRARKSVFSYYRETTYMCQKDPSLASGRNLVTYAVDMIRSESPVRYLSGARILDTLTGPRITNVKEAQQMLIKQLIGSASSVDILKKLLLKLDWRNRYHGEIRERTARIVAQLAGEIRLVQLPRGIQCIASLLETSSQEEDECTPPQEEEEDDDDTRTPPQESDDLSPLENINYKELVLQGLCILEKLAAADEDNCKVICKTSGLLSKIMAPVTNDLVHSIDHESWSSIVGASLNVMYQVVTAPGETGSKAGCGISSNKEAIGAMQRIVRCKDCKAELAIPAVKILTHLPTDTACGGVPTESREELIKFLVDIFTDNKEDTKIRGLAGQKLAVLSGESNDGTIILRARDDVVINLAKILIEDRSNECRISAAGILEGFCIHYTNDNNDDACLRKSKEILPGVMTKVLSEILYCASTKAGKDAFSAPSTDIEGQHGGILQENSHDNSSSSHQNDGQHGDMKLHASLLSFSVTVFDKMISADQYLDVIGPSDAAISFARKLEELVQRNKRPTPNCLRMLKLTSKMVISMMKHEDSYIRKRDDLWRLMDSLSIASKKMSDLDGLVLLSCGDGGSTKTEKSLASLVKDAQELVNRKAPKELARADDEAARLATLAKADLDAKTTLWAQTVTVSSVKLLISITLDLQAGNYTQWRGFFKVALEKHALDDHLHTATSSSLNAQWLHLDPLIRLCLYAAIMPELLPMIMDSAASAHTI